MALDIMRFETAAKKKKGDIVTFGDHSYWSGSFRLKHDPEVHSPRSGQTVHYPLEDPHSGERIQFPLEDKYLPHLPRIYHIVFPIEKDGGTLPFHYTWFKEVV